MNKADFLYVALAIAVVIFLVRLDKKPRKDFKEPIIWTAIAFLMAIIGFTPLMNPPQCTYETTQAQIDASGCIIGANIGIGLYFMFIVPAFVIIAVVSWSRTIKARRKELKKI